MGVPREVKEGGRGEGGLEEKCDGVRKIGRTEIRGEGKKKGGRRVWKERKW